MAPSLIALARKLKREGHSSVAITLDTYSHVLPGIQAAAAQRFDEGLQRTREATPARELG